MVPRTSAKKKQYKYRQNASGTPQISKATYFLVFAIYNVIISVWKKGFCFTPFTGPPGNLCRTDYRHTKMNRFSLSIIYWYRTKRSGDFFQVGRLYTLTKMHYHLRKTVRLESDVIKGASRFEYTIPDRHPRNYDEPHLIIVHKVGFSRSLPSCDSQSMFMQGFFNTGCCTLPLGIWLNISVWVNFTCSSLFFSDPVAWTPLSLWFYKRFLPISNYTPCVGVAYL